MFPLNLTIAITMTITTAITPIANESDDHLIVVICHRLSYLICHAHLQCNFLRARLNGWRQRRRQFPANLALGVKRHRGITLRLVEINYPFYSHALLQTLLYELHLDIDPAHPRQTAVGQFRLFPVPATRLK